MKEEINPNRKLESVIKNSDLSSLVTEYGELALDSIIDDGVLRDFPVVGTVIGLMKFGSSINQHFTAKKLYKFLFELKDISQKQRNEKINEINNSKKYQSSVGELIFEFLDKIDSDGKPEIIGRLFKAVIEEKIDFNEYLRLTHIIKTAFYFDLVNFNQSIYLEENNWSIERFIGENRFTIPAFGGNFDGNKEFYLNGMIINKFSSLTRLGRVFVGIGMKK